MATAKATTFSDMLNEYLVYSDILMESFKDQNWLLQNANIKEGWLGGELIVPFQQSYPTSVKMGGLTAEGDIDDASYVRGSLAGYQEMWGTLKFNSRDLLEHNAVSEKNFLKLLPDQIDQMTKWMKQTMSIAVLNSGQLDNVVTTGTAGGVITIGHPERHMIGSKLLFVDDDSNAFGYVRTIDKATGQLTIYDARTGGSVVDMSGIDTSGQVFVDDQAGVTLGGTNKFGSIKDMVFPAFAGGSDTFAGQTKTASTFTQSVLYDAGGTNGATVAAGSPVGYAVDWGGGAGVKANRVLDLIFDAHRKCGQRGGEADTYIMSWKHFSGALLSLERNSGAFKNVGDAVHYAGYSSIRVGGVHGSVELVAIREMNDDCIIGIKKEHLDFHTNKGFKVQISPDGLRYYTVRNETGYVYITDTCFYGDFLIRHPWACCGIHNINNYNPTDFT
jgi:hypothetical protein